MEKNKIDEIVKAMFNVEDKTLSADDLEKVTGGTISKDAEEKLIWGLGLAKQEGMTMNQVLELVPQYYNIYHILFPDVTIDEAKAYIKANWNKV